MSRRYNLITRVHGGLVPIAPTHAEILRCSSPIVDPPYPWISHLWIQPTLDGNFDLWFGESMDAKPKNTVGQLYVYLKKTCP